jgi:Regulator of chromosome condensation (RCC1) repeat
VNVLFPSSVAALSGLRCAEVACGMGHTVCVADGSVYSWGWGASGQQGNGTDIGSQQPVLVDSPLLENVHVVKVRRGRARIMCGKHGLQFCYQEVLHLKGFAYSCTFVDFLLVLRDRLFVVHGTL